MRLAGAKRHHPDRAAVNHLIQQNLGLIVERFQQFRQTDPVNPILHGNKRPMHQGPVRAIRGELFIEQGHTKERTRFLNNPADHLLFQSIVVNVEALKTDQARQARVVIRREAGGHAAFPFVLDVLRLLVQFACLGGDGRLRHHRVKLRVSHEIIEPHLFQPSDFIERGIIRQNHVRGSAGVRRAWWLQIL